MRITDLLKKNGIALNVNVSDKSAAISKLVSLHEKCGNLKDTAAFKEGILKREEMGATAVGMEVAIPHAKSDAVKAPALTAITVPNGVDYDAADKKPCKLIFMIAATTDGDVHLEVLARLMQLLMDEEFTAKLKTAKTADEFLSIIDAKETEKFPDEAKAPAKPAKKGYRVLAVTACPTGIAHTYMAAEALVKAGEKMGITVKVETNGSGGAKNVLTAEEIANCDGIIIAADKSVETARFDGKPVYSTKVSDGINKPEELIKKIIDGQAPVYRADHKAKAEVSGGGNDSIGRQLYKHLMNGVSHMLPFVVAGGIFIAIAFLIDTASGVQAAGNSAFGSVNPVAAWFKTIGGYAFNFMLPILAGFIAKSIADRPGLLVGFIGGFLASNGATFVDPAAASTIPSGFLGALLAGFAGGYLMLAIEKLCDKLPNALEGIKPVLLYPLAGLGMVGVMMCAINPIMGIVNTGLNSGLTWLSDNNLGILLGCILGSMMSIDMGGPFNKAAYVFGTGMLTTAAATTDVAVQTVCYQVMASVMIGGMVPPLAIALSTTFFKNRWTAEERKNGVVNYVMGLSFITEGAIPYAASSPLKVIPSCAIGAAVAGGLSWLFGCTLMAPHGGIFVVATIGNPLLYLLALAIGSVVGMILLTILKKPIDSAKK
ncbi:fructose-specific PTS transporter subunit EIIC [Ruminococcus sp.]|uniref:PTS fructose transporter subunit IIABC n=1 Tax=Ruminococcus sp. TaxID=41978 RepID=UPI0026158F6B|nr:fructose-specific PTS transporter subunit EIIC [Ruminococcus sp.]MDD6989723.1 fructose-specific PTS transporter subunit EIIC [Ruminococcus sp.]MDY6201862.1 fructose-specific PTS transporter subunit EIIC [Ruminococcus sp.]